VQVRDEKIAAQDAKLAEREAEIVEVKQRLAVLEAALNRVLAREPTTPVAVAPTAQH
jgi:outer membrane protein TolC